MKYHQNEQVKENSISRAYSMVCGEEDISEKPEGKKPLGRQRIRWVDIIKINIRDKGWNGLIGTRQGQVEGSFEYVKQHSDFVNFGKFLSS